MGEQEKNQNLTITLTSVQAGMGTLVQEGIEKLEKMRLKKNFPMYPLSWKVAVQLLAGLKLQQGKGGVLSLLRMGITVKEERERAKKEKGKTQRNPENVVERRVGVEKPNLEEIEITRKKERRQKNLKRVTEIVVKKRELGVGRKTINLEEMEITIKKEKERGRRRRQRNQRVTGTGKTKRQRVVRIKEIELTVKEEKERGKSQRNLKRARIKMTEKERRNKGTIILEVVVRKVERKEERKEERMEEITVKNQEIIGTIMILMNPPTTRFGVLIFHWSKFCKNVWKTR